MSLGSARVLTGIRGFLTSGLLFALLVTTSVVLRLHERGSLPFSRHDQTLEAPRHDRGAAAKADVGRDWLREQAKRRILGVVENERLVGELVPSRDEVRSSGGGKFSLSGRTLYFSASDKSDAATNGKSYALRWIAPVPGFAIWLVELGAGAVLLAWLADRRAVFGKWLAALAGSFRRWRGWWAARSFFSPSPPRPSAMGDEAFRMGGTVFALTLVVLLINYKLRSHDPELGKYWFNVCGAPYTDGLSWMNAAECLARGINSEGYLVYRPGYSLFLASFFTWMPGHTPALALILNAVLGALISALVALIGRRLINPAVGIFCGLAFCLHQLTLDNVLCFSTETLGLFLFVLAVRYLLVAIERCSGRQMMFAGFVFGLSNVTRPLSLMAVPALALMIIPAMRLAGVAWRGTLARAVLLGVGVTLALGPWLVRQKVMHGVWALSTNTADAFYAATSPKYKFWTTDIYYDNAAELAKLTTIKQRYEFFNDGARQNFKEHTWFFVQNVAATFIATLAAFTIFGSTWWMCLGLSVACHAPFFLDWRRISSTQKRLLLVGSFVAVSIGTWLLPMSAKIAAACAVLVAWPLLDRKRTWAVLVLSLCAFTGVLGGAMFGIVFARTSYMIEWMFLIAYAAGVCALVSAVMKQIQPTASSPGSMSVCVVEVEARAPRWFHALRVAVLLFFVIGVARVAWLRYVSPAPPAPVAHVLSGEERSALMAALEKANPALLLPGERGASESMVDAGSFDPHMLPDTKLVFMSGWVHGYFHHMQAGREVPYEYRSMKYRRFRSRDYDRSFFFFGTAPWPYEGGANAVLFPGFLPDWRREREHVLVCRLRNAKKVHVDNQIQFEGVALIPRDPMTGELDFSGALFADNPKHMWYATGRIDDIIAAEGTQ